MLLGDAEMRVALTGCASVAIVGAKDKPGSAVDRVGRYLIDNGFTVYPVHPVRKGVWGLQTYANLAELPNPVDIVNLFRAAEHCPEHARETLALSVLPKIFWMQLGIFSFEARSILAQSPIMVIEDLCLMVEHRRLMHEDY
ncbi:CoA-binding protein [Fundidesulfovibrio terrae]|uniref:CoA-binding protein n=1 Tax=Fundidesulfovibrio terrae TaxID=2922866 RepID=UPI001FB023FD|nr:CoA-binding protein [Fundidesulfovibrio terrae]